MPTIGIFDSGAGGLSVFREIYRTLPEAGYIYFADNAFCPYGDKPRDFIISRARSITDFLLSQGADIIVVACNTATAASISTLREEYSSPDRSVPMREHILDLSAGRHDCVRFIGMEPAVKPAAMLTKTGVIGVLATAGTLSGQKYRRTRDVYSGEVEVVEHVGEGFVELVESGCVSGAVAEKTVRASLQPLLDAGADVIVLGCTHYLFLIDVIRQVAGPSVSVIDPAPAVAHHLVEVMQDEGLLHQPLPASPAFMPGSMSCCMPDGSSAAVHSFVPCDNILLCSSGSPDAVKRLFPVAFRKQSRPI